MTVYQTSRLFLQEAQLSDGRFFLELMNSPTWIEFIGDRGIDSIEKAQMYIENSLIRSYKDNGFGLYKMVLKGDSSPIGICGLVKRPELEQPDIGFAILPRYAQKGYTTEAAKATLQHAQAKLNLSRVLAITSDKNWSSQKLICKIGLQFVKKIQFKEEGEELLLYQSLSSDSKSSAGKSSLSIPSSVRSV